MYRFALILLFLFLSNIVVAKTIIVGKEKEIKSIKQGISLAKDYDTVLVQYGVYKEGNIILQRPVTLIGINYPVLDGESKYEIITINGRGIKVAGFVVKDSRHSSSNDYAAIKIIDATEVTVESNKVFNANFGIHISNSTYCSIKNNVIKGEATSEQSAGNGIHLWKSDHAFIQNNRISGHRDGIYFEFVTESEIRGNISENNIRYGLHFMFSHKDNYINNTFRNNGTGVAVMYTHHVRMEGNTFQNNWGTAAYGILLKDITDSYMINNKFIENTVGILMEGVNRMEVKRNIFKSNGWAMKVQANCADNNINNNNFLGNTFDVATNGTLVLSKFNNNYWDKYEGYDMNKDGTGDVPYHPISMYSMVIEQNPSAVILLRSFMVSLLDKAEKAIPSLTPENLIDARPSMKAFKL